jgi:uncharacterized protein (DUF302 family)
VSGKANADVQSDIDSAVDQVLEGIELAELTPFLEIDHSRLAKENGVEMPPSRVVFFSDPEVEIPLLELNIRAGLDLPLRILAHAEGATTQVTYTDASFLRQRHGLGETPVLAEMDELLAEVVSSVTDATLATAPNAVLTHDYGVVALRSDFDVVETIARLKQIVMAQGDTVWFGEIDFSAEAASQGVRLPAAQLLLFGGPAPGGVAMAEYTAIGLDAFCQKLLVYEDEGGVVQVLYNDIAALAQLHYGTTAPPHQALNARLKETFLSAVKE